MYGGKEIQIHEMLEHWSKKKRCLALQHLWIRLYCGSDKNQQYYLNRDQCSLTALVIGMQLQIRRFSQY